MMWWSWWLWSGWALAAVEGAVSCGAQCTCRGEQVACSHGPPAAYRAHRLPAVPAHVRHVSVSAARLGALCAADLDSRRLTTLVLVASHLHHIEHDALASMTHTLASLDLGYNEFTQLPIEALRELKVLNWLNLQNNYIDEIAADTEWGALGESLSSLSLSNNQLVSLRAGALAPLRRLAQLDLEGNRLHAVEGGALPAALALLRLSDNLVTSLPCAALGALPRLRHLHLRSNSLRDRPPPLNASCVLDRLRIEYLDLSQNELDDRFVLDYRPRLQLKQLILDLNDFTSIPSFVTDGGGDVRLEKLSISYNRLSHVSDATLFALKRDLERLELDHNELWSVSRAVRDLTRLRHLSLAYNRLEEVDTLPPRLHSLGLAGNFLQGFPSGLQRVAPATLLYLDLGYNQIATISRETFGAWSDSLATLNLKGNRISHLSGETFPSSLPLRELVLSFNDVYYVERDAFLNLTTLQMLELSTALYSGEFPVSLAPERLAWLSLDNDNIHYVTSEDLMNLPALEYLNLDFNKLVEFPSDVMTTNGTSSLKELRLSYNYINKLNCNFLQKLRAVQHIDLTFNRLLNLSENCFVNMPNLAYLSISENEVESLGVGTFSRLPRLEVLDLHHNRLEELSTEYFDEVSADDTHFTLNVSHNRIASLVAGLGRTASVSIDCLDLSHNKLKTLSKSFFESVGAHLRQLVLSHNTLSAIDHGSLGSLPSLQILSLNNNNITVVKKRGFAETPAIEILDLSHNRIHQLSVEQFHGLRHLRDLRLNDNEVRSLPRDCLENTMVEYLDLSGNRLSIFPSSALAQVGFTLRRLELARNRLEYLDAAMFHATAFLHELNLSRNALTVLADNTFAALARLRSLDLSGNAIKTNFKELFQNVPRLRRLALVGSGLRAVPPLPLADLVDLDLAGNPIASYREADVRRTVELRTLRLADNRFTSLRPAMWTALPRLLVLDVSGNPLVRLARGSLEGLGRLQHLRMERLRHLEAVEPRAFRPLVTLRSLALDSPTTSSAGRDVALAEVAASTPSLESLRVTVRTESLDAQLAGVRGPRLREVEVRGAALRRVSARAFVALGGQRALTLRVRDTGVATLPAGLARQLARVSHLALDLSHNELVTFTPDILYPNLTGWDRFGTKILSGGLVVSGDRLSCDCGVSWASAWLRRWTAEVGGGSRGATRAARASWCGSRRTPLVALHADRAACRARALSSHAARPARPRALTHAPAFLWIVLLYSIS